MSEGEGNRCHILRNRLFFWEPTFATDGGDNIEAVGSCIVSRTIMYELENTVGPGPGS